MIHYARMGLAGCLVLAASACGTIPQGQLTGYASAFDEARIAGLLLYDQLIPAEQEGGGTATDTPAFAASLGPATYDRSDCAQRLSELPALRARCDLLQAVTDYHAVLIALNQGASVPAVSGRLGELSTSLASLTALAAVPQAQAVVATTAALLEPLSEVITQALTLADRAEAKRRLESAAPTIAAAIGALRDDVPRIHRVQRAYYELKLRDVEAAVLDIANPALAIAARRDRPTDPEARLARRALDERFNALFDRAEPVVGARLADLPREPTSVAMTPAELVAIEDALDAVAPELARFDLAVDDWGVFMSALHAYDDMLEAVGDSLTALVATSSSPFTAGGGLAQLDGAVVAVRGQAREIGRILAGM